MLKAIVRTGAAVGTLFLAGYIARRYFGVDTDSMVDNAKSKAKEFTRDLKAPLENVADRHAI